MASAPRRRWSRHLPPELSELMDKLTEEAASFIQQFNSSEVRMRQIVEEFLRISDHVKDMQRKTDTVRKMGAVIGAAAGAALAVGASIIAAPFTEGTSSAEGSGEIAAVAVGGPVAAAQLGPVAAAQLGPVAAAQLGPVAAAQLGPVAAAQLGPVAAAQLGPVAAVHGPVAAAVAVAAAALLGAAAVVGANVRKMMSESGSAKELEKLGKEFLVIIESMKKNLEEIKTTCEKLEVKAAEAQAENTLTEVEELQRILRRVSELKRTSAAVLTESISVLNVISQLMSLTVGIFRVTATTKDDKKLEEIFLQLADQSQKVINEFDEMKKQLRKLTDKGGK